MFRNCLPSASTLVRLAAQGHAVRAMSAGRVVIGAGRPRRPRKAVMELVRHPCLPLPPPSVPLPAPLPPHVPQPAPLPPHLGSRDVRSSVLLHARTVSQTETAAARITELLEGRRETEACDAVRVGIKARGCNGLSYTMQYATDKPKRGEEEVEQHGATAAPQRLSRPSAPLTPLSAPHAPQRLSRPWPLQPSVRSPRRAPAGVRVYIESKALMHIIGTTMDYVQDELSSEFVFTNPNAEAACGCGESFTTRKVEPEAGGGGDS